MDRRYAILEHLTPGDRLVVLQDDREVRAAELQECAAKFEALIRRHSWQRVALQAGRADAVIAALAAGQSSGCDVLLARDDYPPEDPVWAAWQVDALVDGEFETRRTFPATATRGRGCVLLATSGTTGRPKAAAHSIETLASRAVDAKLRPDPARWLLAYHPAGFAGLQVILTAIFSRSELIALSRPDISALVRAARTQRPTHVSATPTFWRSLLVATSGREERLPLRQITLGGEAVDQSTLSELARVFPLARLIHIYATTEAGVLFAVRDRRPGFPAVWLETGVEGTRLRIRDGVLEILSPRAMQGYVGEPARRNQTEDGWLISGDLVELAGDRVLFRGRADNVINVGGAKVMPEEVENVLRQHDAVREARVYGRHNPLVGAVVCAEIVLAAGLDPEGVRHSILSHAARQLESHKQPRILHFVPAIATNAAGKKVRRP